MVQDRQKEEERFSLRISLNEGEWQQLKIPFRSFVPEEDGQVLDDKKRLVLSLSIPFLENYEQFFFDSGNSINARLLVDDIGFFTFKGEENASILETFEDEVQGMIFHADLYESRSYIDYSESDEGRTLAEAEEITNTPILQLDFELPPERLRQAAAASSLDFVLGLDDFVLLK